MVALIPDFDMVMREAKRDMLFTRFAVAPAGSRAAWQLQEAMDRHFAWFEQVGLRFHPVAPRGWLEGMPSLFAVHFTGIDDPRVAAYSSLFEDSEGKSLRQDLYQMVLISYAAWCDNVAGDNAADIDAKTSG